MIRQDSLFCCFAYLGDTNGFLDDYNRLLEELLDIKLSIPNKIVTGFTTIKAMFDREVGIVSMIYT